MKRNLRAQSDFSKTILRNQLTSLVLFESITTTKAKAKQLIPFVDRFFNRVKSADLNAKKLAAATFFDNNAFKKTFEEILPRYSDSDTNYVRHFRVMPRKGDSAEMLMVSLIKPLKVDTKSAKKSSEPAETTATKKVAKKPVVKSVAKGAK